MGMWTPDMPFRKRPRKGMPPASGNARAAKPEDLAEIYAERSGREAQVVQNLGDALQVAQSAVSREDIICITGSFYLVGEAKQLLAN